MASYLSFDRRRSLWLIALGIPLFALSWYLIHHGWFALDKQWDTKEYNQYARDVLVRHLFPYKGFPLEYPPLSLPIFLIPRMIAGRHFSGYMEVFGLGMAACGVIALVSAGAILTARRVGLRRMAMGIGLVGLSPLLLGPVLLSRYDLFPAMLSILALAALYRGWDRTGFLMLALGTAAKAYPAVIVPIAAVHIWRTRGHRRAIADIAIFAGVVLTCFAPFLIASPSGVWAAIHGQASRPPQLESLGAALFLAAHQLIGLHVKLYFTHMSDNIDGHPAQAVAGLMSVLQLVALCLVWVFYAAGPATRDRLLVAAAAAVCAFIVFDRVLSPQYLIWLAPLVAVLPGRRGLAAMALLASAMVVTQVWYPEHFVALKLLHPIESWAVVVRDLMLFSIFATLAWPERELRENLRALPRRLAPRQYSSAARV
jgi:hypothetical protein